MTATLTPLDAALSYARLGWPVVPLHTPVAGVCDCPKRASCGDSSGKHPRTMHGLDDSSTDEDKIRRWWKMWPTANVAVDLVRAGIVDVAPDSIEWQAEFIARGLPQTVSFQSGGGDGHEHHFYKRSDVCPAYRSCHPDEYDIMSAGYAVMPPSLHVSGRCYAWLNDPHSTRMAPVQPWVVRHLEDQARPRSLSSGTTASLDVDEAPVQLAGDDLALWNGELVRLKPGGAVDRSLSLWEIGRALARAGASQSAIARALQDRDETLGWSKYSGRRDANTRYAVLAHRVLSGEAPRIRLKQPAEVPATDLPATTPTRRFHLLTADELKARPDPEWSIDGVLQKDTLALLVGAQETLKTFAALDMALCTATNTPWQGHPITQPGVAIYVSSEGGSGLGLRVSAWEQEHDTNVGARCLFLADQAPQLLDRKNGGDVDELLASIHDLGVQPALIVIDTAARSMVGGDENSAQDMGLFIASADQIRQATGAVVMLVHHNNKAGSARGSTALLGAVHTIIESSREEQSRYLLLRCGKQKDADHFASLMIESVIVELDVDEKTGVVRTSLVLRRRSDVIRVEPAAPKLNSTERLVLGVLIELKQATFSDWREACKVAKTTFLRTKAMLINHGFVAHEIDQYRPTAAALTVGSTWVHSGSMDPSGPSAEEGATEGPQKGPTGGALKGGPRGPLDPGGPSAWTQPGEDLPW